MFFLSYVLFLSVTFESATTRIDIKGHIGTFKCELGVANNNLKNPLRKEEKEEITLAMMKRVTQKAKEHTAMKEDTDGSR